MATPIELMRRSVDGTTVVPWVLNTDGSQPVSGPGGVAIPTSGVNKIFRSGFASAGTQPDPTQWDIVNDTNALVPQGVASTEHLVTQGGNSAGASYLRISLSPFVDGSEVSITTKDTSALPMLFGYGMSMSQRVIGQEVFCGIVGVDSTNAVVNNATPTDKAITGTTITVTSNIGLVTMANHGYNGGDRVTIFGCPELRLNVGPVTVTPVDANTFQVAIVLANGSYSSVGGFARLVDPLGNVKNGAGMLYENATVTNGSFVSRRNGAKFRTKNETVATTTATQSNPSPFTDAFNTASTTEFIATSREIRFRSFAADGVASMNGYDKYHQGLADEGTKYKFRVRVRNLKGFTMPVGRITAIAKTGTTTATVTTDVAHGLATNDWVQVYGVRDQANFPNLTAQTQVTVVDSTHFTVVIGTATTTSSAGGTVFKVQGSTLAPGASSIVAQSVSRTSGVMTIIGNGTWGFLPGEFLQVWGMDSTATQYDGAYKVLRISGTTMDLEAPGADFASINCGGAVMRRTDVRLHFVDSMDFNPFISEIMGGFGNTSDINGAVPVALVGGATIGVSQSTGNTGAIWTAAGYGGVLAADIASAALTTTTTTTAVTPGIAANIGTFAHSFNVIVTAVSGTTPTLDVGIEESVDNGTNWVRIYDFERITATGFYTSPLIRAQYGTRYRYVQTVGGTTPSFTRSVNRDMISNTGQLLRRFMDRSIVLTTLNSTTPTYNVEGCDALQLVLNLGTAGTPPQITLQASEDGTNFWSVGTALVGAASSTVVQNFTGLMPKFVRAFVSTIGVTVTPGYVSIKALGR